MITKDDIKKIGFTQESIFIETKNGEIKSHPLEWFSVLQKATPEERENYSISPFGVHWEALDMDLSFDGFFHYQKQNDNDIAQFFREFPEIISRCKFSNILPLCLWYKKAQRKQKKRNTKSHQKHR